MKAEVPCPSACAQITLPRQLQRRLTGMARLVQGQHGAVVAVKAHHVPVTHSQMLKDPVGCAHRRWRRRKRHAAPGPAAHRRVGALR